MHRVVVVVDDRVARGVPAVGDGEAQGARRGAVAAREAAVGVVAQVPQQRASRAVCDVLRECRALGMRLEPPERRADRVLLLAPRRVRSGLREVADLGARAQTGVPRLLVNVTIRRRVPAGGVSREEARESAQRAVAVLDEILVPHDEERDGRREPPSVEVGPDLGLGAREAREERREARVFAIVHRRRVRVGERHVEIRVDRVPRVAHEQDPAVRAERPQPGPLGEVRLDHVHAPVGDALASDPARLQRARQRATRLRVAPGDHLRLGSGR
mmetsp:Transcript_20294/g.81070  ORF Transcript_20294/g.81070 Transcript_20294/m.81070 type:complete len:272 (-) Transcript_20294:20-835(-)